MVVYGPASFEQTAVFIRLFFDPFVTISKHIRDYVYFTDKYSHRLLVF